MSFVFYDPATAQVYKYWPTLALHDALPIWAGIIDGSFPSNYVVAQPYGQRTSGPPVRHQIAEQQGSGAGLPDLCRSQRSPPERHRRSGAEDRKSTRLNYSH